MTSALAVVAATVAAAAAPMAVSAPPPAFARTSAGVVELERGSSCWSYPDGRHLCVDYAQFGRLPRIVARRGEIVRFRLWFQPTQLNLRVGRTTYRPRLAPRFRIRARGSGEVHVFPRGRRGEGSYDAQLVVRDP